MVRASRDLNFVQFFCPGTLDFFVFSYFRVFVIDLEELPWAMTIVP